MKENKELIDIPAYQSWLSVDKITKGWSDDIKYIIRTQAGEKRLLRISDIKKLDSKKKEYEVIQKYARLGLEMSKPIAFGTCNQGKNVYMLLSWIEGADLETVLARLPEQEQYELGRSAGTILRAIHSIPVAEEDVPEKSKKEKKLRQLLTYENSQVRIAEDEIAISYVKEKIDKIWSKPPVYQHGDFHPGNLILTPEHTIGVIDFNRWEVGDPYEEFYKLESFATEISIPYSIGQIDAYFEDEIPDDFWEILAVYVAHASLYSIKWAEKFGQSEIDGMVKRCRAAFLHYDNFKRTIPTWYDDGYRKKYQINR